jgi:hypothetical protein
MFPMPTAVFEPTIFLLPADGGPKDEARNVGSRSRKSSDDDDDDDDDQEIDVISDKNFQRVITYSGQGTYVIIFLLPNLPNSIVTRIVMMGRGKCGTYVIILKIHSPKNIILKIFSPKTWRKWLFCSKYVLLILAKNWITHT